MSVQFESFSVSTEPIPRVCKSPAVWGHKAGENVAVPLFYIRWPKWIDAYPDLKQLLLERLDLNLTLEEFQALKDNKDSINDRTPSSS